MMTVGTSAAFVRAGKMQISKVMVLVALVLTTTGLKAQTLQEALVKTYQTNPDLAAERSRLRQIDEGVAQANAKWRPTISVNSSLERSSDTFKSALAKSETPSETWTANIVASQPLLTSGRNSAEKRQAEARVKAGRARLEAKEQSTLLKAIEAFVQVARNEAILDLVRSDIALLSEILKEQSDLKERKRATDSDVDQTLAALEAARSVCISNVANLQDSWRSYEQVVGEVPNENDKLDGSARRVNPCIGATGERIRSSITMPTELPRAPASLEDVEKSVLASQPEVTAARADEEASKFAISAAYAELLPKAGVSVKLASTGQEIDPWTRTGEASVIAELKIPIFRGGSEWSDIRTARERNNQARLQVVSTERQGTVDAVHAWYKLVSIRSVRRVNRDQAASLQRAFNGLRKEIVSGKQNRSITDLLGLRQALLSTRIQIIQNDGDEVVTIYRLLAAAGNLNASQLELPVTAYDPTHNLKRQSGRWVGSTIYAD